LRVCDNFGGCEDADVIPALYYAANNGADVINLSLGKESNSEEVSMRLAVENAVNLGAVVVAAAGNGDGLIGDDNDIVTVMPASLGVDGLLSVAMTDHADALDPSSNFGDETVHLGAPGVSIFTAELNGAYGSWSGTSFASPTTAGVAALIREHRQCFTPQQIAARIQQSGDSVSSLDGKTISGKRLNAFSALAVSALKNDVVVVPAPGPVSFTGGTGGTVWTYGDGETSVGASAQHVYADRGLYYADDGTDVYEIGVGLEFTDTCDGKFATEIMWLSASGVTLGCDAVPNFCPEDEIIRAQMATMLARALDLPPASGDYFSDDNGMSHEENINRLFEAGITLGCGGGEFCPTDNVTREQMASFLVRAFALPTTPTDLFDDDGGTHEPDINALAESGITLGCGTGTFCPENGVTRQEMAAFIFRGRSYLP